MCVAGSAEEGQYDPCRIQGPTHKVLGRSGSEIQDGQVESESGAGGASFVYPGCFFSLDMCCLFTYGFDVGGSLKQVGGSAIKIRTQS